MKWASVFDRGVRRNPGMNRRRSAVVLEALEPRLMLSVAPNDPMYGQQWYLNNTGQYAEDTNLAGASPQAAQTGTLSADINAQNAWTLTTGSHNVVVGILDTGLDITHPDLAANVFTNTVHTPGYTGDIHGWNFVDNSPDVTDYVGHGTNVAGIIGAVGNNGVGVSGINWNVSLLPLKIGIGDTDEVDISAAVKGLEYAVALKHEGVNIVAINASFGGQTLTYDPTFDQALHDAANAGILFVVAAGNDSASDDAGNFFPAKYSLNNPNVITVAATDNRDDLAFFSNYGQASVTVAAPGVAITNTWSRMVDDKGGGFDGDQPDGIPDGQEYNTISGTSMATPMVTGIIALEAAADPNATMLQLKDALITSVHNLPSLQGGVVATAGRVDAYHAVLNILNQYVDTDNSSAGNWLNNYGLQGEYVVGAASNVPSYVSLLLKDASGNLVPAGGTADVQGQIISPVTSDTHALQNPSNPSTRILGQIATDNTMTFDLDFTDNQIHRVSLYATDLQNLGRTEEITIRDAATGTLLNYQGLWNFQTGRYVTWDLSGHVLIQVHNTKPGGSAIVNGLFFDQAPQTANRFVKQDTTTQGRWQNSYGSEGSYIVGQGGDFPSLVGVDLQGNATGRMVTAKGVASSPVSLDNPSITNPTHMLGYFATPDSMTFDMHFTDGQAHQVGVYLADYENAGRAERIDILDSNGNVLDTRRVSNFSQGAYLFWNLDGNMKIRITRIAGPDAVVSGFFFDAPAGSPAQFLGSDRLTSGNWQGIYGFGGATVFGDQVDDPASFADVQILPGNNSIQTLVPFTTDPRAPQLVENAAVRQVTYLHTTGTMKLDVNITDNQIHRLTIYALDWDRKGRVERIDILDPSTGQVLSSQTLANFQNGAYLSWNIRGHVQVQVTRLAGPTAPISGYFFD